MTPEERTAYRRGCWHGAVALCVGYFIGYLCLYPAEVKRGVAEAVAIVFRETK